MKTTLENYLESRLKPESVKSYLYVIGRFLKHFPNAKRLKLTPIESYFAELKQKKHSIGYRTVELSAIKAYYDYLVETGLLLEHPCKSFFISEKKPTGKNFGALLSMTEMAELLTLKEERFRFVGNRNKVIIGLLIYQGITSGELVNLKVGDVNVDEGWVFVSGSRKNRSRTLQLKQNQIGPLMRYIENDRQELNSTNSNKLVLGMRGVPLTVDSIHSLINRLGGAFDKEVSPMSIRNSVICYWLNERKFSLEDVQIMAGHSYPSTTEKYKREDVNEQRGPVSELHSSIFTL